jgi:carbon storage regulator
MLVLSRCPLEKIVIGDNIIITVCKIKDGRVRLGIDAPKGVKIMREELLEDEDAGGSMDDRGRVEGVIGVLPH